MISNELIVGGLSGLAFLVFHLYQMNQVRQRYHALELRFSRMAAKEAEGSRSLQSEREERVRLEQVEDLLGSTVARIPWMIRDLMECNEIREIPDKALNLVEELFLPRYVTFLNVSGEGFVVTHVRGDGPFAVGSDVGPKNGVVPWTAQKQLVTMPEDVTTETGVMRREYFSGAECEFSFCIPVVLGERTAFVILIGPCQRSIPSAGDFAKAVGVMTAQSLRSIRALAQQTRLAITDGLTGLLNKKYIQECLQERVMSSEPAPLGVFLFDIDHFKHYNDRNGHLAGDDLLRSVSELLREITREGEVLGRYGGEEFLLLMPNADEAAAMSGAERIRAAIAKRAFRFSDGQPLGYISVSGGVAAFPQDGRSAGQLIAAADQALYEAKRSGRDCVKRFEGPGQVMHEDGKIESGDDGKAESAILVLDQVVFGEEG